MTDEKLSPKEYLREHDADGNATIRHTHDPASGLDAEPPDSRPLGGAALALLQHEALAALAHEQWSGWMGYLFEKCAVMHPASDGSCVIPAWAVERWKRQMATPYAELSEEEKESDRKEASRVTAVLGREWKIAADELDRKLNDMAGRLAERLLELGAARTRIAELEESNTRKRVALDAIAGLVADMYDRILPDADDVPAMPAVKEVLDAISGHLGIGAATGRLFSGRAVVGLPFNEPITLEPAKRDLTEEVLAIARRFDPTAYVPGQSCICGGLNGFHETRCPVRARR